MLTKVQLKEFISYHNEMCNWLLAVRKECQEDSEHYHWYCETAKKFEGRVVAARHIAKILGVPTKLLDYSIFIRGC